MSVVTEHQLKTVGVCLGKPDQARKQLLGSEAEIGIVEAERTAIQGQFLDDTPVTLQKGFEVHRHPGHGEQDVEIDARAAADDLIQDRLGRG